MVDESNRAIFLHYMNFQDTPLNAADGRTSRTFILKRNTSSKFMSDRDVQLHLRLALHTTAYVLALLVHGLDEERRSWASAS